MDVEIYCGWCDAVTPTNTNRIDWEEALRCPECDAPTRIWINNPEDLHF